MRLFLVCLIAGLAFCAGTPGTALAQSLIWNINVTGSANGITTTVSGSVTLAQGGGTGSFTSGGVTVTVTTSLSTMTIQVAGVSASSTTTCTGTVSGSGTITSTSTSASAGSLLSGALTCNTSTFVFIGTFVATGTAVSTPPPPVNDMALSSVAGTVTVTHNGVAHQVVLVDVLTQGDRLTTGADGSVTGTLPNGTQLLVGPNSELVFEQEGGSAGVPIIITQISGNVDYNVTCSTSFSGCFQVVTPNTTASVAGTRFTIVVSVAANVATTTTSVAAGTVNQVDTQGVTKALAPGDQATVTASLPSLAASVLPSSRAVRVGTTATAFATVINAGPGTGLACTISPPSNLSATFSFQTTNPSTNALTGSANTPVSISAGKFQTFIFSVTPTAPFDPTDLQLNFTCNGSTKSATLTGINTLLLSASTVAVADVVALAATATNDGILHIPGTGSSGAFAVASVNVGATDTITVSVDTGSATSLPVTVSTCQTNPATGQCTSAVGSSVTTSIASNATPTFAIFVKANGQVLFDPANSRVYVRFKDATGATRGSTSVAVTTQ